MAGNLQQVGSDGKRRVKSDSPVVAGASDPCCCTVPQCTLTCTGGSVPYAQGVFYSNGNTYWPWVGGVSFCLSNMPMNTGITQNGVYGKITSLSMPQALTPDLTGNVATSWSNANVGTFQYYSDSTYTTPTTSVAIEAFVTLSCSAVTGPCQRPTLDGAILTIRTSDANVTFFSGQVSLSAFAATIDTTPDPTDPMTWIWYADACMNNGTGPDVVAVATAGASGCIRLCLDWECFNCGDPSQGATPWTSPEAQVKITFGEVTYTNPAPDPNCGFLGDPDYVASNWGLIATALSNSTLTLVHPCPDSTDYYESSAGDGGWELVDRALCEYGGSTRINQTELVRTNNNGTPTCGEMTITCNGPTFNSGQSGNLYIIFNGGIDGVILLTMDPNATPAPIEWYAPSCTNPARLSGNATTKLLYNTCKSNTSPSGPIGTPVDFPYPV